MQSVQAPRSELVALHRTRIRRPNSSPQVTSPPAIGSGTVGLKAAQATTDSRTLQLTMRTWRAHTSARGQAPPNHRGEKRPHKPRGSKRTPAWNDHMIPNQGTGTLTSVTHGDGIIDRTVMKGGSGAVKRTVSGTETRGTLLVRDEMNGILTVSHTLRRQIRQTPKSKSEMPYGEPRTTTHRPVPMAMTCRCLILDNTPQSKGETA